MNYSKDPIKGILKKINCLKKEIDSGGGSVVCKVFFNGTNWIT